MEETAQALKLRAARHFEYLCIKNFGLPMKEAHANKESWQLRSACHLNTKIFNPPPTRRRTAGAAHQKPAAAKKTSPRVKRPTDRETWPCPQ